MRAPIGIVGPTHHGGVDVDLQLIDLVCEGTPSASTMVDFGIVEWARRMAKCRTDP